MTSKKSKSQDHDPTKKKKSSIQKESPEPESAKSKKEGIERFLKSDVEIVDVTEETLGQSTISYG